MLFSCTSSFLDFRFKFRSYDCVGLNCLVRGQFAVGVVEKIAKNALIKRKEYGRFAPMLTALAKV